MIAHFFRGFREKNLKLCRSFKCKKGSLIDCGAINGYPDRTFRPETSITRAKFVTVLVKALNIEPKAGIEFADTSGHWARSAVATAWAHGLVKDITNCISAPMIRLPWSRWQ
ncbi:MAG: S-layer homology domain-containing protein [Bacillota bacterium]